MRRLFICNTYMQLLTSLQIIKKIDFEGISDLILSDHSSNSEQVGKHLREENVFEHVYYVRSREYIDSHGRVNYYKYILLNIGGKAKKFYSILEDANIKNIDYDEVFMYNRDAFFYSMFFAISKKYKTPVVNAIEEGFISYKNLVAPRIPRSLKLVLDIRAWFYHIKYNEISKYYCCFKQLLPESCKDKCIQLPLMSKNDIEIIDLLRKIFHYNDAEIPEYIYFGSSLDGDGFPIDEYRFVEKIADIVGKENFVIKKHPRDKESVYRELKINEYDGSYVPWEVISLIEDFDNKTFFTLFSTSILNSAVMTGANVKGYYLYPLIRGKNQFVDEEILDIIDIENILDFFKENGITLNFKVITSIKQLEDELMKKDKENIVD